MVLRLSSKKTLPILIKALESLSFTQTELSESTKTSIGRVNKVINWLKDKNIIIKTKGKYTITQPNRLTDLISAERTLIKKRTYYVSTTKEILLQTLGKEHVCLLSSLELIEHNQREKELSLISTEHLITQLNQLPRGEQGVHLYEYEGEQSYSSIHPIITIIDLKSMGQAQSVEALCLKLWGTRQ